MKRKATAEWSGGLKDGNGKISSASGALRAVGYGFSDRFESGPRTNPEELIGAAHAGCFSMALSAELGKANLTPERIQTEATVTFESGEGGWSVTGIHLDTRARVPGATREAFAQAAEAAKRGCPISRLLAPGTAITLDAKLEA